MEKSHLWLAEKLQSYTPLKTDYKDETDRLLTLDYLKTHPRAFYRNEFSPGHITASAWVVNPARTRVLLMKHKYLGFWFQFGGHADGNGNLHQASMQELTEETGLPAPAFTLLNTGEIFDIDLHYIPANPKKDEPLHLHYDIRFAYQLDDARELPPNPEGLTIRWMTAAEAAAATPENNSVHRMLEKTEKLA